MHSLVSKIMAVPLLVLVTNSSRAEPDAEARAALDFRKIFAANAAAHYSPEDIQKLIFLPNHAILDRPSTENRTLEEVMAEHRSRLQTLLPSQLYQEAARIPHPDGVLQEQTPVTIIIIPGIFGEFIDHIPYEEVLGHGDSALAQIWGRLAVDPLWTDPVFDLDTMSEREQPLSELVAAGSIDNAAGEPMTQIILLKAPKGSLESLGTLAESAAIYQRRLSKIFERLGSPERAYFLGYSRGLNVGMELVSTTDPAHYPWMRRFHGLIGLGGVTYGSAVADMALDETTIPGKVLARIDQLARDLEIPEEGQSAGTCIALMLRNTKAWARALLDIAALQKEMPPEEGLALEKIKADGVDLGFLAKTFKEIALDKFQLDRPFSEYGANIKRFKIFVRESFEGIRTLTTQNCVQWMRGHTLPDALSYYAITTVMPDPSTPETGVAPLTGNHLAFEVNGLDYQTLRTSYYSYFGQSGMSLNDSQISLDRSPFWPALHEKANPDQKPFRASLLAVLGTDHWGMAFPVAFETQSGKVNPFPRTILIKTLGEYLGAR